MRADTLAIRDRLLAVLREADRALTTYDVCDRAGPYREVRAHRPWMHEAAYQGQLYSLVSCDGVTEVVSLHLAAGQKGYVNLRALERQGLVRRVKVAGEYAVRWLAVDGQAACELEEIEAMWSAS